MSELNRSSPGKLIAQGEAALARLNADYGITDFGLGDMGITWNPRPESWEDQEAAREVVTEWFDAIEAAIEARRARQPVAPVVTRARPGNDNDMHGAWAVNICETIYGITGME